MTQVDIQKLIRPHLLHMRPYSSARDEFTGKSEVYLDANENSLGSVGEKDLSRYPDPHQLAIKEKLAPLKSVNPDQIFIGNGSDEPIDLLIRAFCRPGKDEIIILPPTYGMYEVSASVNDVKVLKVPLTNTFGFDIPAIENTITDNTKIVFTCNPNNPTGTRMDDKNIIHLLDNFNGLVVVDEAYIDFSNKPSFIKKIEAYNNLVILQTFSKAWGLAAARVGMLFGNIEVVNILNRIKPPYNVNQMSQEVILYALDHVSDKEEFVKEILEGRETLLHAFNDIPYIEKTYQTDANFILIKVPEPGKLYGYLMDNGIIVRDRSNVTLCEGCLRITIGSRKENKRLLASLNSYNQ